MKAFVLLVFLSTGTGYVLADNFGTGDSQFTIDFVTISGDASSANGTNINQFPLTDLKHNSFADPGDFRMGTYEITNDQWSKFADAYGAVTGSPSEAYGMDPSWTGANIPTNRVSWFEAAQFVNWLNTSTNHSPAYKFTGTQGTSDYTFVPWETGDSGYDPSNPFRNIQAHYFLPTENEWVKAAYWNGAALQTYATNDGSTPAAGVDSNYDNPTYQPWDVGSGFEELNGTFDMMGNVWEWIESPSYRGDF